MTSCTNPEAHLYFNVDVAEPYDVGLRVRAVAENEIMLTARRHNVSYRLKGGDVTSHQASSVFQGPDDGMKSKDSHSGEDVGPLPFTFPDSIQSRKVINGGAKA